MKTYIFITGSGISSKNTLLRNIRVYDTQVSKLPFNSYKIEFTTKKEAVKALSEAYQSLKDEETCISYRRGVSFSWDAGTAEIRKHNE